jgi:hypothetical protein
MGKDLKGNCGGRYQGTDSALSSDIEGKQSTQRFGSWTSRKQNRIGNRYTTMFNHTKQYKQI